jgi:hypothetical protein
MYCYSSPLKELRANIRLCEGFRGVKGFGGLYQTAKAASAVSETAEAKLFQT